MAKAKTTEEKPLTLKQKLSKVNRDYVRLKDNPDSAKKVVEKKEAEKKPTSLKESFDKINSSRIDVFEKQKKANTPKDSNVKDIVSKSKSKRGPSSAGRISGLQGLNLSMGKLGQ
jgi:hypothetical protein